MPNFNKVILIGHITRDPETVGQAGAVTKFGLAVNHKWRTKDGEDREEVCFVDCAAFGKTGETIVKFFKKGKPILVEGRLRFETWESEGGKRSKHTISVESFGFVGGNKADGDGEQEQPQQTTKKKAAAKQTNDAPDDDCPF